MKELNISPRPTRKTRAKGKKVPIEAKLLTAAENLLEEGKSFATMSVDQLAKEAGISRGTFYLHFKDKADLVGRLMDYFVEELSSSFGTWTQNAQEAEREDVMAAVKVMLKTFKQHEMIIIAVRDTKVHDKKISDSYDRMMKKIARMAVKSTSIVKQRGKSRPDTTKEVANVLGQLIVLYCTYLIDNEDEKSLDATAKALGRICVDTIFSDEN